MIREQTQNSLVQLWRVQLWRLTLSRSALAQKQDRKGRGRMEQPVDVTAQTEFARAVSVQLEVKLEVKQEKEAKDAVDVSGSTKWERLVEAVK